VQECKTLFGSQIGAKRQYEKVKAKWIDWHVTRIAKHCLSCSAILKDYNLDSTLQKIISKVLTRLDHHNFIEKVKKKSIELGIPFSSEE
jgi:hypothetical protein